MRARPARLVAPFIGLAIAGLDPALGEADRPLTPAQTAEADAILHLLVAPCCWTASVAEHGSGLAPVVEAEVREMVASGRTRAEILDHYVEAYGERVLVEPKRRGFNLLAYVVPWLAVATGALLIATIVRRGRRAAPPGSAPRDAPEPGSATAGGDPYRARVLEELRRLRS